MTRPSLHFITGTLILVIASIAGCRLGFLAPASRTVAPSIGPAGPLSAAAEGPALYPLEIGNRWHYALVQDFHWTDASGTPQSAHLESSLESELRCVTSKDSRSYTAQRTLQFGATANYTSWIYLRQDRFGLYEADIPTPPPCETAGPVSVSPARAGVLGAIAEPSRLP
jgi:hypothetical protein